MPRLTLAEWHALRRASEQLAQVAGALRTTNWGGSLLAQAMVKDSYEVVAALYNRAEPYAVAHKSEGNPPSGLAPSGDDSGSETTGEG